jgi:glycolate oxidase FAD binding subunit
MEVAQAPSTREELARLLASAGAEGTPVRFDGGGTKAGWAAPAAEPLTDLPTSGLDRIIEHNAGDLTAVLEAGVTLAAAQAAFADAGQMLALDPPDNGATIGGIVATADSGPLRSRFGGVRDLVVGMRVALSDGTLAKSGGKVIKNVAGYDLAKLFAGSFGTLGAIVEVAVRLHPLQPSSATAVGATSDMIDLGRAAIALSREPLEHAGFDVRWSDGRGELLVRFAGAAPGPQAETAARLLGEAGLPAEIFEDDGSLWQEQRARQRAGAEHDTVARVSGLPTQLPALVAAVERVGGSLVGRAPLGLYWLRVPGASVERLEALRSELRPSPCVILDRPSGLEIDPWGPVDRGALELMRRVKSGFDRAGVCSPGTYVGGL